MKRTKKINRSRIIREIWYSKAISRIEIAKKLRLDKSTISSVVSDFLDMGLIIEAVEGEAGPTGGRKPIFLKINKEYGCILGIDLRKDSFTVIAVDLNGEIFFSKTKHIAISKDSLGEDFAQILKDIYSELERDNINLLGVGVGISGIINARKGKIKYSIPMGINNEYNFCNIVASILKENNLKVPVFIDNDANACLWGELTFHRTKKLKDCLFVLLVYYDENENKNETRISVGIGIEINGKVHYGHDYTVGEFRSIFREEGTACQFNLTLEEQNSLKKDKAVKQKLLKELSANLSLFVNTLNIENIILGGDVEMLGSNADVSLFIESAIRANWAYPYNDKEKKRIRFSSFGKNAIAYGAAGMVLNKLFSDLELLEEYSGHIEMQTNAGII